MTERIKRLREQIVNGTYQKNRSHEPILQDAETNCRNADEVFLAVLQEEQPYFLEGDRIGFYMYHTKRPKGCGAGNFIPNYGTYLTKGFGGVYKEIKEKMKSASGEEKQFGETAIHLLEGVFEYCNRFKEKAPKELKKALERVPYHAPQSYHEALVLLRICIHLQRMNYTVHVTLGRFDQYMYPFYKMDVQRGMSHDAILELTEEFFLSLNVDTDLYSGVQKGDNGQSMVLGGTDINGNSVFNELSRICMEASLELNLIDPKINLRVSKNTPIELFRFGTELTKQGMGFPQYCNDDVVIPGLIALGYEPEDAHNYGVAACWEYIVPDVSHDIPNVSVMNFPKVVNRAVHENLAEAKSFEAFAECVKMQLEKECDALIESVVYEDKPSVFHSLFFDPCIAHLKDYASGVCKYNNIGFHGVGIANAADAMAAVKKTVFCEKSISPETLKEALDKNFEGFDSLRQSLIDCPKMGNNDDFVDELGGFLMECFSNALACRRDKRGNRIRPGTGSAMFYLWSAEKVGATADGRLAQQAFGCSFSPAITSKLNGPLSVIQSFTKFDMTKIINGGPLTMEIHDTTFRNEFGMMKVAQLVKAFIDMGGHQLQLNAINRDTLLDAQKHPENYKGLIVRVWGWSGYFNELDIGYQNHIIARTEFQVS